MKPAAFKEPNRWLIIGILFGISVVLGITSVLMRDAAEKRAAAELQKMREAVKTAHTESRLKNATGLFESEGFSVLPRVPLGDLRLIVPPERVNELDSPDYQEWAETALIILGEGKSVTFQDQDGRVIKVVKSPQQP